MKIGYHEFKLLYTELFSSHVIFAPVHLQTVSPRLEFANADTVVFKER